MSTSWQWHIAALVAVIGTGCEEAPPAADIMALAPCGDIARSTPTTADETATKRNALAVCQRWMNLINAWSAHIDEARIPLSEWESQETILIAAFIRDLARQYGVAAGGSASPGPPPPPGPMSIAPCVPGGGGCTPGVGPQADCCDGVVCDPDLDRGGATCQ